MDKIISSKTGLKGKIKIPGDKSISHRAVMFGSLAKGDTEITGFLKGDDCMSTISCFKKLGIDIEVEDDKVIVHGKGLHGLKAPDELLDVGNSGTTIRLISGILAAQNFDCTLNGDASIQKRPMKRVINPLSQMGADIESTNDGYAPLAIHGRKLKAIEYTMPVASAQVKSSVLLASLFAEGVTVINEPVASRDHTEIMLNYFGADIKNNNGVITSRPVEELYGRNLEVPGDISSAAFFMVAGLVVPDSHIIIENVGINPTRTGIIDALKAMGGYVEIINPRESGGELVGDIEVKTSKLKATTLEGSIIPRMIDEIPVFAVAALCAEGTTVVKDATELKVKESNRIAAMSEELGKMGVTIKETEDGMIIEGNQKLKGGTVYSHLDHRVAMSCAIAALIADGDTVITNADCVGISFPNFYELLENL
ncbi:MAG: 3-phosphoshikimate 1-carboxyvinyltransferase [Clostridia bacterium]|nr:3-phosphoshikimate 1-carboxyvinyltransferase [Clostridia bacterium]